MEPEKARLTPEGWLVTKVLRQQIDLEKCWLGSRKVVQPKSLVKGVLCPMETGLHSPLYPGPGWGELISAVLAETPELLNHTC